MRPGDVAAGSAFRTAVVAAVLFALTLGGIGALVYHITRNALMEELDVQLTQELQLYGQLPEEQELDELIDPDAAPLIFARTATLQRTTLVHGSSARNLDATLSTLSATLVAAGGITLSAILLFGWYLSRQSLTKLGRISATLERVADGDHEARIGDNSGDSQIDRISGLIDASLERLSTLTQNTQNTTRAIAHDLRSPLARAFMLVRQAAENPSRSDEFLLKAESSLQTLSNIFDTVLRISRLEASDDQSAFIPLDTRQIVAEVADVFRSLLNEKQQEIVLQLSDVPVMILGDAQMLKQMLTNLLQNFHRHTADRSVVTLSVLKSDDGTPQIIVADDGPGVPEDTFEEVLKPFRRLDESRTEEGNGLGLALVRAIAVRHHATLSLADNSPGLRITVEFPVPPANLSKM